MGPHDERRNRRPEPAPRANREVARRGHSQSRMLVVGLEVGRGAMSGAEVRSVNHELLTVKDGMIVRFREFFDESEALEAAGLSE
jgi:ketosteroid isomerase-like protein